MKRLNKSLIVETAAATAEKVKMELSQRYPGIEFSFEVDEENSEITVKWTDGPIRYVVDKYFESFWSAGEFEAPPTGYHYRGQHFMGALYVFAERKLSPERQAIITERLESVGVYDPIPMQSMLFEEDLIKEGKLQA